MTAKQSAKKTAHGCYSVKNLFSTSTHPKVCSQDGCECYLRHLDERRGRVVGDSGGAACGGGLAVDVMCAAVRRHVGGGVRRGREGRLVAASDGGVAAAQAAV